MAELLKSILLGIIQGITEFVPVSSSGHLVLSNYFLNFNFQDIRYDLILHIGTLVAVIIYFKKDLQNLVISVFKPRIQGSEDLKNNRNLLIYLAISTLTTAVVGIPLRSNILNFFYNPLVSSYMLILTGLAVFLIDMIKQKKALDLYNTGVIRAIIIGGFQVMALMPGISRSGITIFAAVLLGLSRTDAAKYSFLLSIPAIAGACLYDTLSFTSIPSHDIILYVAGFIASLLTGYVFISILMKMIAKRNIKYFAFYCWAVGIFSIIAIHFYKL